MFKNTEWYNFKNEVPKSMLKVSKDCKPFNVAIPIDKDWKKAKHKVLIVCEHVSSEDLGNGRLFSGDSKQLIKNCFDYAERIVTPYLEKGEDPRDFSFAAINYNFFKTYHLKNTKEANTLASRRVKAFIESLKPTHILFSGPVVSRIMLNNKVDLPLNKMGWVHKIKIRKHKCLAVAAPDFIQAIERNLKGGSDDDTKLASVYSLFFFSRCLASLYVDRIPWATNKPPIKYKLIDSKQKFKKFLKLLYKAKKVAVDTETANLYRIANNLLLIQFSITENESYIVPINHRDTPFGSKLLDYINKELRKFFMQKVEHTLDKYLLMFNGKFDITVIKEHFGVPFMYWPVYDVQAGEHLLDETLSLLVNVVKIKDKEKVSFGNLGQILCMYGDDFYFTHTFAKSERSNIVNEPLSQRLLEYGAADTQRLISLHDSQILRAKNTLHKEGKKTVSYKDDFMRMVIFQDSNNIHDYAEMEHTGNYVDIKYLLSLMSENSEISSTIKRLTSEIYSTKAVKKANKILLKDQGISNKNTLFEAPFVFSLRKEQHKQLLFFRILRLKPVEFSKKTNEPSIGKAFKEYHSDNEIVAQFDQLEKVKKVKSTYIESFIKKLGLPDGVDKCLRASYGFFNVLSGRANSSNPSFQQIPEHGPLAKLLKRAFIAPKGCLAIKLDYSAHEVRCWGIMSYDDVIAKTFNVGRTIRKKIYKTSNPKKLKKLLTEVFYKGDVHKLNASFFFSLAVDKVDSALRKATKAIVFGCVYGSSEKSIAEKLGKSLEFVENLFKKFFARFKKATDYLDWLVQFGRKNLFVRSPTGRRRHLMGHLVPISGVQGSMDRRAKNSPIQGFGSDTVHTAARLFAKEMYEYLLKIQYIDSKTRKMPLRIARMVHDSMFYNAPFDLVFASIHIVQWCCVKGVEDFYDEKFGLKFNVPLEIEIEIGANGQQFYKWNWSIEHEFDPEVHDDDQGYPLMYCIDMACKDYAEIYKTDPKKVKKQVMASWKNSKVREYLEENYPILP